MVNPFSYLRSFHIKQNNVNSMFKNRNVCKLNHTNLDSKSILMLADTRITADRYQYLLKQYKLDEPELRFFTTISKAEEGQKCRAGASIIFPPNFLSKVIDVNMDDNPIPRYIFITTCNLEGLKATYGAIYLPANKNAQVKIDYLDKITRTLQNIELLNYSTNEVFNLILAGDFNLSLDRLHKSSAGTRLAQMMSSFDLIDTISEFTDNTQSYATFTGNHKNARPTRIDGILMSRNLTYLLKNYSSVKLYQEPALFDTDHYPVSLEFVIAKNIAHEDIYIRGDDSFMNSKELTTKLDKIIRDTLILTSPCNFYYGGNLSRNVIESLSDEELDLSFQADKIANPNYDHFSTFYKIIDNIIIAQNDYKSVIFNNEYKDEKKLKLEFAKILKKHSKSNDDIKKLRDITYKLQDNKKQALVRKARNIGIKAEAYGEGMTKYFLTQNKIKKSKLRIKVFQLDCGKLVDDPQDIACGLNAAYKNIFNAKDPYNDGMLDKFLGPQGLEKLGQISQKDKTLCETDFSLIEVDNAVKKISLTSKGGYDKVTGTIFQYIYPKCKQLILNTINMLCNKHNQSLDRAKIINLIFLPKTTNRIDYKCVRPIGLCSIIYKIVAHLLATRLNLACIKANIIPSNFFAFLKGCSGSMAVRHFRDRLELADSEARLFGLQIDFSGAYDFLSRKYIYDLLKILGFGNHFINVIWNNFQGVKIKIEYYQYKTTDFSQSSGVTQGSPLSVQLYTIACIPLTIKLDLCQSLTSYQPNFENKHLNTKAILKHYNSNPPPVYDKNFSLSKSAHYADDGLTFLKWESIESLKKLIDIYDNFGELSAQRINKDKTYLYITSPITQEELNEISNLGFLQKNIIFPGGEITFVGYTNIISQSQLKADYQTFKDKTAKISKILDKWKQNFISIKGRILISNQLCASQLAYFYPNMLAEESWFSKIQRILSDYVNKKKITNNKLHFLHSSRGGTSTPYLYLKYLIAKSNWFKLLAKYEKLDRELWPDFCTLVINLKNKYNFPTFHTLFHSNNNDWIKLANIFMFHGLNFWGKTIMEYIKLRKINSKPKNRKIYSCPWQDLFIFGCAYNTPLLKTAKTGASPHQLLRPPELFSLSTRSKLVAEIITKTSYYKLGHFILYNGEPNPNFKKCYDILKKSNKTNIGSEQINFLNYLYKCCIELLHKHNKSKKPTGKINKDHLTEYLLGFNDSISIYNRITCCIYKPEIHPCLDKWYTTKIPGLKITNRQISKGLRKLFSIQTCFKHLKYSQELILCSFRIEKHLIHFPDHPTKKIRFCNACLGDDSINHIFLACPIAQILWLRLKLIIQAIIRQPYEITKDLIFLCLGRKIRNCSQVLNRFIISLSCAIKSTLATIYYKRSINFSFDEVDYILERNIKSVFQLYSHYNIDIPPIVFNYLVGKDILCSSQMFDFLLKIRSAFYQNNIDVDSSPRLYNFFTTSYNKKGEKMEFNFGYVKYCLKDKYFDDIITKNPLISNLLITKKIKKNNKKNRTLSDYKLRFVCQIALDDTIANNTINIHGSGGFSHDIK